MEAIATRYRTHTCGQIRASDQGKTVTLAGWVHNHRDHGGVVLVDLRDRAGMTQVVFHPDTCGQGTLDEARKLRSEWVLSVTGTVEPRGVDEKTGKPRSNPKLGTGEVELAATGLVVLSTSATPPFTPDEHEHVNEEKRLAYRYLDLRRPEMQQTLRTRYRVTKIMRDHLGDLGFWEIETPFLTRSTPEGSRDFLVPSRLVPGSFYALPQSPQLFKQILMVGGCDKYMQIVRCFRDEDPRADRQAEFTQLDVEMSFVDRENVIAAIEGLLRTIWKQIRNVDVPDPIPHMSYDEAMTSYGSDRPDLRFGMTLHDLTDLKERCVDFDLFRLAPVVKCICVPSKKGSASLGTNYYKQLSDWAKQYGGRAVPFAKATTRDSIDFETGGQKVETFLTQGSAAKITQIHPDILERVRPEDEDVICFVAGSEKTVHKILGELRLKMARDIMLPPELPYAWVWVTDFPLLDYSEEDQKWVAVHHPFTSPLDADIDKLDSRDPAVLSSLKSKAYDIVLNGSELGGGSIRIHRMDVQQKVFDLLGIDAASQRNKFGFLLDALQYGAPPHGGIALGVDRVTMILRDTTNIRDVIAFPKTQSGADLMCGAPAPIEDKQLREANIRLAAAAPKLEGPKITEHK